VSPDVTGHEAFFGLTAARRWLLRMPLFITKRNAAMPVASDARWDGLRAILRFFA
jgi:hypothetical protein